MEAWEARRVRISVREWGNQASVSNRNYSRGKEGGGGGGGGGGVALLCV